MAFIFSLLFVSCAKTTAEECTFLNERVYSNVFLALSTGIRVRSCDLRWNKLAELLFPVPPIEEQKKIISYIDEKIKKVNEVIYKSLRES